MGGSRTSRPRRGRLGSLGLDAVMLDLVVYGASGLIGRLICKHLRRHAPHHLRWALAGRDPGRLEAVAAELSAEAEAEGWPTRAVEGAAPCSIIAGCDAGSAAELLSGNTRCVLSAAGPFMQHSDSLVAACARGGTHYVDINGEVKGPQGHRARPRRRR